MLESYELAHFCFPGFLLLKAVVVAYLRRASGSPGYAVRSQTDSHFPL